jgi:hypothetical protein
MFESDERILADVVDGGPNRNLDLAIPVSADPAAAWVFEADSAGEQRFLDAVLAERGSPRMDSVSIYRVYTDVSIAVLSHYDRPSPDSGGGSAIP